MKVLRPRVSDRGTSRRRREISLSVSVKRETDSMEDATRTCGACRREVAEVNFTLHESHCRRFLCVCEECDEPVHRQQLQAHREEQHTQVKCSKCNKKMERRHLMDHELEECVERSCRCEFCDLDVTWKQLDEHTLACGSRTELCSDCGRYVTLRKTPEHRRSCSASSRPPVKLTEKGVAIQQTARFPAPVSPAGDGAQQIGSCPFCHLLLPLQTLRWHQVKCRRHLCLNP